jgi:hypothetical protein
MQSKEEIRKCQKQYRDTHKEEIKKYMKQYRADNKEEISEYGKEYNKKYYQENKEEIKKNSIENEIGKKYYALNKVKMNKQGRVNRLKKYFGITVEQYNFILDKQNGCCNMCKKHHSEFKRALAVDHDHSTGLIRGLLCHSCNRGLGYLHDNIDTLINGIEHLKSNPLNL